MFKTDIPLAERSAWEDGINRDRAEIARLSDKIHQAEAEIERIPYDEEETYPRLSCRTA